MAEMVDGYRCRGCGRLHKLPPYYGYSSTLDFGRDGGPVIVVTKRLPDGAGGHLVVVLDVTTRPPT